MGNADADPIGIGGRLASSGKNTLGPGRKDMTSCKSTGGIRRSSDDGMRAGESQRNTGIPSRWGQVASTGSPRGSGRAVADASLGKVFAAFDCDFLIVSGKPSELPGLISKR